MDNAQFVYFLVLLVVFGSLVFFSGRLGENLRNLALWGIIILALIVGYSFKDRIIGELFRGDVPAMVGAKSIEITRNPRSHHFETQMFVNDARISALIDTGASAIVLSYDDAEKAGIDTESLRYNIPVLTANGETRTARATLREIRLAEKRDYDVPVQVAQPEQLDQSLIGMQYLRQFSQILIEGERLKLSW